MTLSGTIRQFTILNRGINLTNTSGFNRDIARVTLKTFEYIIIPRIILTVLDILSIIRKSGVFMIRTFSTDKFIVGNENSTEIFFTFITTGSLVVQI